MHVMNRNLFLFSVLMQMVVLVSSLGTSELSEYCPLDTFQPTCNTDEVVIIKEAVFGRIRLGKCISSDYKIGCAVDVLDVVDRLCSGKMTCSISIPSTSMTERLYCLKDYSLRSSANLEASFLCQKVYIPRSKTCRAPEKIPVSKQVKYLSSIISKMSSCGLHGSPWILEAEPGQQIEINMMDFSWKNDTLISNHCPINYGYILNMDNDDVIHICGGGEREKELYISSGHSIQIVLENGAVDRYSFLLNFKAIGCSDYKPPNHSWIQKENDTLVIGCVSSDKTWRLRCVDNRWLGMVGNCTPAPTKPPDVPRIRVINTKTEATSDKSSAVMNLPSISNNHVIVFTIACLTILICCVVIILGAYYIKRYNVKIKNYSRPDYSTTASYHNGRLTMGSIPVTYRTVSKQHEGAFKPPAYTFSLPKDKNAPKVPPRNTSCKDMPLDGNVFSENNTYENVNEDAESVKYYILENPGEPEGSERL